MLVCFCIALPTFLCGCDPDLQPSCLRYKLLPEAEVVGYSVVHSTCSTTCWDLRHCTTFYYDCYTSYAKFSANCSIKVDSHNQVRANALEDAQDTYPLGSLHVLLQDRTTGRCYTRREGRDLAIVGISFFTIMGVLAVGGLVCEVYHARQRVLKAWEALRG